MAVSYELFLLLIGFGILSAVIGPALLSRAGWRVPLSLPMACLAGGIGAGLVFDIPRLDLIGAGHIVARITELAVILSLTGCGLKLDRPIGLRRWGTTWRLLSVTMVLCIAGVAVAGWALAGLPWAAALLLGAVLAPTDPVLAASVQVGPPGEGAESEPRFALTSEAGLNDGLAFPFVYLAIGAAGLAAALTGGAGDGGALSADLLSRWLAVDVIWKIGAGTGAGVLIGFGLAWLAFRAAPPQAVSDVFLAIGLMLFSYAGAELIGGYGFISVFVAALAFRRFEHDHALHVELHHFVDQTEQLMLIAVMFATGIVIAQGAVVPAGWGGAAVALALLLVIRPLAGWVGLAGAGLPRRERRAIAALGIRGVGSFYYLAYGLSHGAFSIAAGEALWGIVVLTVALSVVIHGLAAPRVMARLIGRD